LVIDALLSALAPVASAILLAYLVLADGAFDPRRSDHAIVAVAIAFQAILIGLADSAAAAFQLSLVITVGLIALIPVLRARRPAKVTDDDSRTAMRDLSVPEAYVLLHAARAEARDVAALALLDLAASRTVTVSGQGREMRLQLTGEIDRRPEPVAALARVLFRTRSHGSTCYPGRPSVQVAFKDRWADEANYVRSEVWASLKAQGLIHVPSAWAVDTISPTARGRRARTALKRKIDHLGQPDGIVGLLVALRLDVPAPAVRQALFEVRIAIAPELSISTGPSDLSLTEQDGDAGRWQRWIPHALGIGMVIAYAVAALTCSPDPLSAFLTGCPRGYDWPLYLPR